MSDIIRLLADAIRGAEPDGDPFADQDLCVGEAMEGFDWITEEHIQALCEAAAKAALSALADAGLAVVPVEPTMKMLDEVCRIDRVICDREGRRVNDTERAWLIARDVWDVMLAAAPWENARDVLARAKHLREIVKGPGPKP